MASKIIQCLSLLGYDSHAMARMDWEKERERLRRLYGGMHDSELEKIAADADSLTAVARTALRAEMLSRGLEAPPESNPEPPVGDKEPDPPGPVLVGRYTDLPTASVAKSILDSAGIEAVLSDDNVVRLDWFYSNAVGGIKLLVREEDAEAARRLLEQEVPEKFDVVGIGEYEQPRCPQCQSMDVSFKELDKKIAYPWLLVLPVPVNHRGWNCHSCGYAWEGDPNASHPPSKNS